MGAVVDCHLGRNRFRLLFLPDGGYVLAESVETIAQR